MNRPAWAAVVVTAAAAWQLGGPSVPGQEARPGPPGLALRSAGRTAIDDLRVRDMAVADDSTVLLVGAANGPEDAHDRDLDPNGWVVDLNRKRRPRRFTNGHAAPIMGIAVGHGMVATTSTTLDPVLRIADLATGKEVAAIDFGEKNQDGTPEFAAQWLHQSARLAARVRDEIQVFDPKRPRELTRYRVGARTEGFIYSHLAVSRDDKQIACAATLLTGPEPEDQRAAVFAWAADRENPVAIPAAPPKIEKDGRWFVNGLSDAQGGSLFAWRSGPAPEVPKGVAEKDVSAERRAIVRIDLERRQVVPTGMGTNGRTLGCGFDPTGKWLAVVGFARPDGPEPKDDTFVSEVRVYEAATARLVCQEQVLARTGVSWVGFSPSGKRLCAASANGVLFWWDVEQR